MRFFKILKKSEDFLKDFLWFFWWVYEDFFEWTLRVFIYSNFIGRCVCIAWRKCWIFERLISPRNFHELNLNPIDFNWNGAEYGRTLKIGFCRSNWSEMDWKLTAISWKSMTRRWTEISWKQVGGWSGEMAGRTDQWRRSNRWQTGPQLTSEAERLMKKSCWPEMCAFARAFFPLVSVVAALPLRIQLSALGLTHFLLGSLWSLDSPLFISFRPRRCRLLLLRRLDGQTLDTDESLHYRLVLFPSRPNRISNATGRRSRLVLGDLGKPVQVPPGGLGV